MKLASLVGAAAALAGLCSGCGGSKDAPAYQGTVLSPPLAAPGFTLHDQSGRPVSLRAERKGYVVVTFLYTHCPDVCPVIAGTLNRVLQTAVARRAGLRVLAVSVDPKQDTPAAVDRFVREHRLVSSFRYLTGPRSVLQRVWKGFHVAAAPGPNGTVTHSTFEILIDPQGRERLIYDSSVTAAAVEQDLEQLVSA
jgi:protein SCO1/2